MSDRVPEQAPGASETAEQRLAAELELSARPPISTEQWQEKVAREVGSDEQSAMARLGYTTADGVELQALYGAGDLRDAQPSGLPGAPPFTRGTRLPSPEPFWTLGQLIDDPCLEEANEAILRDLQLGAQMLWLRVDRAGRQGLDADDPRARGQVGCDGVRWGTSEEIETLLRDVEPRYVHLVIDAGGGTPAAAALFFDWARRRGVPPSELRGGFCFDPFAVLAEDGELTGGLDQAFRRAAELARFCQAEAPGLRALAVSMRPLREAGTGPAQELGFGLAAAVATLRRLESHGLGATAAASQLAFLHSLGSETFLEIAKLRAARLLWAKVLKAAGVGSAAAQQNHVAFGSEASVTVADPWVNMLRATGQTFSAVVGGADAAIPIPFDRRLGTPSDLARRITLTTQHVLGEESHLRRVADPAGGSWTLESLTDRLARAAWAIFRETEAAGGYEALLLSGALGERIAKTVDRRRRDISKRKTGIVGLSVFPLLAEQRPQLDRPQLDAVAERAVAALDRSDRQVRDLSDVEGFEQLLEAAEGDMTVGALTSSIYSDTEPASCEPLRPYRPSAGWERLRLATDEYLKVQGTRPPIFLANLGTPSQHRARTEFAAGFFSAAGVEPVDLGHCEHAACSAACFRTARANTGVQVAVLCSSDDLYLELAAETARELKAVGASRLYLAGRPGDQEASWRDAGVDEFIYVGCDALECLQELLVHLEVLR
ncbi:MAG: acyl-CoA mutase large subunit family protein [Thermoanaerobaculia bacterium]|nr:acyl-CoA mutase large subunit family protein [Thermoanaerobaculia bacterium]